MTALWKRIFWKCGGGWITGNFFIVRCPLESIEESAAISNQFYIYIGVLVILVSTVIIWLLARRMVKPLQELTALSERMANLDFNAKYTSGGEDEIGELGQNLILCPETGKIHLGAEKRQSAAAEGY